MRVSLVLCEVQQAHSHGGFTKWRPQGDSILHHYRTIVFTLKRHKPPVRDGYAAG